MIKLADPEIGQEELVAIKEVISSKWLTQGDKVEEVEDMISEYLTVKHVIAVSSGTAALHLALLALNVSVGDEVIVPDFTFPAVANVVEIIGAKTVLCDIDAETYCLDTSKLERLITQKTRVIIPVHEFGHTADMNQILELSKRFNISIIEDAACALGAEYNDIKAGTIGDIGCFSLHPRKVITTGEGGIIVTNDSKLANKLRMLRNHGLTHIKNGKSFVTAGLNYRMTNIQGAIGSIQTSKLTSIINKRRLFAEKYNQMLHGLKELKVPICKDYCKHVYQTYHILLDNNINRDHVIKALRLKGIETNIGAYSISNQPYYYNKYRSNSNEYKNSINAFKQGLALPLHTCLCDNDIDYVVSNLLNVVRGLYEI